MGENDGPAPANADSTRGVPYYEKLKRDLRETLTKKKLLDKNMAALEDQIYRYEGTYLEETGAGNIIKGFDNYIKGATTSGVGTGSAGGGAATRKKTTILDHDRLFSRSSASFMKEVSPDDSTQSTPSHAPTPTSTNPATAPLSARESNHPTPTSATSTKAGGVAVKKNRKGGPVAEKDDEESEGKQPKRLKITYARGGAGD